MEAEESIASVLSGCESSRALKRSDDELSKFCMYVVTASWSSASWWRSPRIPICVSFGSRVSLSRNSNCNCDVAFPGIDPGEARSRISNVQAG